jgi:hypothetical protein
LSLQGRIHGVFFNNMTALKKARATVPLFEAPTAVQYLLLLYLD